MFPVVGARSRGVRFGVVGSLVVLVASVLVAVVPAPPAQAHAELSSSSPRDGSALKKAPSVVTLNFNEVVSYSSANVQLLNGSAAQVQVKVTSQVVNGQTRLSLTPVKGLSTGRFAVRYSVTSADGHVITGAFAFSVKSRTVKAASQSRTLSDGTVAVLSGAKVGKRTIALTTPARSGVVELTHPSLGAPLRWKVTGDGKRASASGLLPFAGTWSVTSRLRVSQYRESVGTGSFSVSL